MRILRAADRPVVPWKNGGGLTREVIVWPTGARIEDFQWRVSLAEMDKDAPFSIFPGVDRVLNVLQGKLSLVFADGAEVILTPRSAPFPFAGEAPVSGCVLAGPVLDLNVMSRRGDICATVRRRRLTGALELPRSPFARLVLARSRVAIRKPRRAVLGPNDALLLEPGSPAACITATRGTLYLVTLK